MRVLVSVKLMSLMLAALSVPTDAALHRQRVVVGPAYWVSAMSFAPAEGWAPGYPEYFYYGDFGLYAEAYRDCRTLRVKRADASTRRVTHCE